MRLPITRPRWTSIPKTSSPAKPSNGWKETSHPLRPPSLKHRRQRRLPPRQPPHRLRSRRPPHRLPLRRRRRRRQRLDRRASKPRRQPKNDAEAMATTLRQIGFTKVTLVLDQSREQLVSALGSFAREAEKADWAVV